jgi:serine/threonine protein kinase
MARDPASRYATALGFAEDLERVRNRRRVLGTTASLPIVDPGPEADAPRAEAPGGDEPGIPLGHYIVRKELGRGDLGVVHLAWDTHLGRNVALKLFKLDAGTWERKILHSRHEAEVTARIENPAICPIYDFGVEGDTCYIAMRYVEGVSLAQVIDRTKGHTPGGGAEQSDGSDTELLPLRTALQGGPGASTALATVIGYFERTAHVLHQVHEAGVVHRDIKPGNLMVTPTLEPVLIGLGWAEAPTQYAASLFTKDTLPGTPAYMSPEKIRTCKEDRRGDIWSFGATLYETFALRPAFRGATWQEIFEQILVRPHDELSRFNPSLDPALVQVVDKTLAKDPSGRPETALDLAEELRRVKERLSP